MTTKSLKETLKDAGYIRLPTLYVSTEDAEMIHYIAGKHMPTIHAIEKEWRANICAKMPSKELRALLDAGVSYGKIAEHFDVHIASVGTRAKRLGYPPREPGYRETPNVEDVLNAKTDT
jgi:hypothetical protein